MAKKKITLENKGSLITYKSGGQDYCLGYLFDAKDEGVFDSDFGEVDVTPEDADTHNKCLSKTLLEGLDENCQIGQGGSFYWNPSEKAVKTWTGDVVAAGDSVSTAGPWVTFRRKDKIYRGRVPQDSECFNFKRVTV